MVSLPKYLTMKPISLSGMKTKSVFRSRVYLDELKNEENKIKKIPVEFFVLLTHEKNVLLKS